MEGLTRSQHPDLRLFTKVPGKKGWLSNRSFKTMRGAEKFLNNLLDKKTSRRGVEYSIIVISGNYVILAKPVVKGE